MIKLIKTFFKRLLCEHEWKYDYSNMFYEYHVEIVHQVCRKCGKKREIVIPLKFR